MPRDGIVNEIHIEADTVMAMENLAKNKMRRIVDLKEEIKGKRINLDSYFESNHAYAILLKDETEIKESKKKKKAEILASNPAAYKLSDEVDSLKQELKESQDSLTGVLKSYAEKTGQLTIEDYMGHLREIEMMPKLRAASEETKKQYAGKRR